MILKLTLKRWLIQLRHLPQRSRGTIALWIGAAIVGVLAVMLAKAAEWAFAGFESVTGRWFWWPFISLPLGGMAIVWLMRRIGPGAEGSGIQQAMAALHVADQPEIAGRLVNLKLAATKFVCIVAGLGSGFVLGREGPTVQIGASIMYACRKLFPLGDAAFRRQLILAGGAAGIAAAFNTPLAGIVFAFEELASSVEENTSGKILGAVILSGVVSMAFLGSYTYFGHIKVPGFNISILPPLLVISIVGGLLGGAFSWLCVNPSRWLPERIQMVRATRPYLFVVCCGLLIAICGLAAPIFGSGAEVTSRVVAGEASLAWYYLPLKFVGLLSTYLTGLPGGIFAPSLSLGAGLGSWFLPMVGPELHIKLIAIGMTAVLAAVTRAPLTSAFILMEMTDGHAMVISIMATAMIASTVARIFKTNFYHDLAERALAAVAPQSVLEHKKHD
ncbi:chloride channel protein [Jeongeupia sp. HS-3]|uniref:chloride channel protein n=1 Tax=Jeongeupia sp. HS-3 TaxID=1009682 RepID=UPI0018A5E760|nr:chloride channel protein [Jeongeupia sp. HS-3]BCL76921.1 chloride channel protein [Jeongeupia sp. HS-3]